jgi:light-regulated signal transduction histidine kinase (bacteriophytochrome)
VDKMIKWGAVVDPKDRDALIEYLSTNFPAEKAPQPAERVAKK